LEMIPQDDGDDYFDLCIFLSDVVEHGSSIWNRNHPKVQEQFNKVRTGYKTGHKTGHKNWTMKSFWNFRLLSSVLLISSTFSVRI